MKDYASNNYASNSKSSKSPKNYSRSNSSNSLRLMVIKLFLLLLVVILTLGLIFFSKHHRVEVVKSTNVAAANTQVESNSATSSKVNSDSAIKNETYSDHQKAKKDRASKKKNAKNKGQFKSQVAAIDQEPNYDFYSMLPQQKLMPGNGKIAQQSGGQYVLKIANTNSSAASNDLAQHLSTLGFDAIIEQNNEGYQVLVGPYSTIQEAETNRQRLLENKIKNRLLRLNSESETPT